MGCTHCKIIGRILLSNFDILILIVFLLGAGLIFTLLFKIFKDLINSIFNYNYEELKTNLSEIPTNIFTVRLDSIDYLIFRGFCVKMEIYSNFVIFKMFNNALLINDLSQLSLTGKFTSKLVIKSDNNKIELVLGRKEYSIIKDFLEDRNV